MKGDVITMSMDCQMVHKKNKDLGWMVYYKSNNKIHEYYYDMDGTYVESDV